MAKEVCLVEQQQQHQQQGRQGSALQGPIAPKQHRVQGRSVLIAQQQGQAMGRMVLSWAIDSAIVSPTTTTTTAHMPLMAVTGLHGQVQLVPQQPWFIHSEAMHQGKGHGRQDQGRMGAWLGSQGAGGQVAMALQLWVDWGWRHYARPLIEEGTTARGGLTQVLLLVSKSEYETHCGASLIVTNRGQGCIWGCVWPSPVEIRLQGVLGRPSPPLTWGPRLSPLISTYAAGLGLCLSKE
jgi:hypothetical protein